MDSKYVCIYYVCSIIKHSRSSQQQINVRACVCVVTKNNKKGGYLDVVNFLLGFEDIVDKNAKTYPNNTGTSPLWMAESIHGLDHPVTRRLEAVGAIKIGPETTRPSSSSSSSPQGNEDVDDDINNEE